MAYPIYSAPSAAEVDYQRKLKLAEMLRQQSQENLQGQMVSGHYVAPSWTQGLAKLLQAKNASDYEKQADDAMKAERQRKADALRNIIQAGITETPTTETVNKPGYEHGGTIYDTPEEAYKAAGINPNGVITQGIGAEPTGVDVRELNIDGSYTYPAPTDWMSVNSQAQPQGFQQDGVPVPNVREVMREFTVPGQPETSYDAQKMLIAALSSGDLELASNVVPIAAQIADINRKNKPSELFGKVMPGDYTPESLAKFAKSGNYADLVQKRQNVFGNVNPGQFTPESLARYESTGNYADLVPRFAPQKLDLGNSVGLYDPVTGQPIGPVRHKGLPPQDLPSVKGAQASAVETAKTDVDRASERTKQGDKAAGMMPMIDEAEKILKSGKVTGSYAGAAVSAGKKLVGVSDEMTKNNAQLKALSGWLTGSVPRFEGPQSDADRQYYLDMAGRVGDETVPAGDRLAALQTVRYMQVNKMRPGGLSTSPQPGPAQPKGTATLQQLMDEAKRRGLVK